MSLVEFHQQSLSLPDSTRLVDVRPAGHVVIASEIFGHSTVLQKVVKITLKQQ